MFTSVSFPLLFSIFLLITIRLFSLTAAQFPYNICGNSGNFTANSTYQSNLNRLLSILASNGSVSGFSKSTVGQIPDQVYGLVLCRGDINTTECSSCITTASQDLLPFCPYNKAAMIWYDFCFLRFSNEGFLAPTDLNLHNFYNWSDVHNTNLGRFDQLLSHLLSRTTDWAMANSTRRFSTGEVSNFTSDFPTIYGLVQCTPDMTPDQCGRCLRGEFSPLPTSLVGRIGGTVLGDRCITRYDVSSFFEGAPSLRLTVPPPQSESFVPLPSRKKNGRRNITRTIIEVATPVGSIILFSIIICIFRPRRRKLSTPNYEREPENITNFDSIQFDLSILRVATNNFSEMNKLGEGGFGAVYKGLLPNGQEIAVKRVLNIGQGLAQLKNELVLVAKLKHKNLVRLLGVCSEVKMIVYEYVPNGSLDMFLFDRTRSEQLHWGTRYKIIRGIARGLLYLHEESQLRIIHRDLKPSNVLLDANMNSKISDFGLAKLFDGDQSQDITNRVMGTFGYMAPEYVMRGKFSIKSDVFGFGVIVLEILTGRRISANYDSEIGECLLSYIWRNWNKETAMEIIDPTLNGQYQRSDVLRCIEIGLLCVQENPLDRPTMRTVDLMLDSETFEVQPPSRPAFCGGRSSLYQNSLLNDSNVQVAAQETGMSNNEVSISELGPR